MVRTAFSSMAALAVMALMVVGCADNDVTDLEKTWNEQEQTLVTKLSEVKGMHEEQQTKLMAMPTADTGLDSAAAATRNEVDQLLQAQATIVGEVEATLNEMKTKREEAKAAGDRAAYEAAMKEAQAQYEGAIAKLETVASQQGDVSSKLDNMSNASMEESTTPSDENMNEEGDADTTAKVM